MLLFLKLLPGCRKQDRNVTEEAKLKYMFDSCSEKRGIKIYQKQDTFLEERELVPEGQTSLKLFLNPSCWIYQEGHTRFLKLKMRTTNGYCRMPSTKISCSCVPECTRQPQSQSILYLQVKGRTQVGNIQARSHRELSKYTDSATEDSEAMIHVKSQK